MSVTTVKNPFYNAPVNKHMPKEILQALKYQECVKKYIGKDADNFSERVYDSISINAEGLEKVRFTFLSKYENRLEIVYKNQHIEVYATAIKFNPMSFPFPLVQDKENYASPADFEKQVVKKIIDFLEEFPFKPESSNAKVK